MAYITIFTGNVRTFDCSFYDGACTYSTLSKAPLMRSTLNWMYVQSVFAVSMIFSSIKTVAVADFAWQALRRCFVDVAVFFFLAAFTLVKRTWNAFSANTSSSRNAFNHLQCFWELSQMLIIVNVWCTRWQCIKTTTAAASTKGNKEWKHVLSAVCVCLCALRERSKWTDRRWRQP